jgi:hypothetical protein
MKRRTLDIILSSGGLGLAVLLVVLGMVLTSNASFAKDYVADQLTQQNITFTPAEALSEEEQAQPCLVTYAGQALTNGKQAECYANSYIGLHLQDTAGGMTYAELGPVQRELRDQVTAAEASNDPALADLETELADVTQQRETVFKGETLRGLLLTSYGFSEFGVKGDQVATVAYIAAFVLLLLAAAGFFHAFRTPRNRPFAPVEEIVRSLDKELERV